VSVSVVAGRRIIRRRVRNSDEGSDDQPSSPEVERQGEPVAEVVMSASSGSPM
jgi:hypothetical protein